MSIVMYLGSDVKDYEKRGNEIINKHIENGDIRCDICTKPMERHSSYERGKKESGEEITVIIVRCKECNCGHALLPDFISPHKQYSGNEIEYAIIESVEAESISHIETKASESTVRRWICQVGERIERAINILKYLFLEMGRVISEVTLDTGPGYAELEQVLEMAPSVQKHCGNKLGLANIWLGKHNRHVYI